MYVKSRMSSNPYTVTPDATIAEALELMRQHKIRRLPVVKSGKLVGIITERALLEVSPSKATTLSVFEINYLLSKTKVSTIMTKDVITVSPDTLLEEAAVIMRDNEISALPVLEGEKLVGIITETDIFSAFTELMGFRDKGTRISVRIEENKPGVLAAVAKIIAEFDINITHLGVYRDELIIRVNTLNVDELLNKLNESGYKVISVLKNYD